MSNVMVRIPVFISIDQQFGANSIFLRNHKLLTKYGADETGNEVTIRKYQLHHGATSYQDKCIKKKEIKITRNQYFHEHISIKVFMDFSSFIAKKWKILPIVMSILQYESKSHKLVLKRRK